MSVYLVIALSGLVIKVRPQLEQTIGQASRTLFYNAIDGQVSLVPLIRLQTDNFRLFLRQQTDKRQTFVCTMSKRQTDKEKSPGLLFFCFPFKKAAYTRSRTHDAQPPPPHTHTTCTHKPPSPHPQKTEPTENGNFRIFAANGKRKRKTSVYLAANGNGKRKSVFLGRKTINGNRRLLFSKRAHLRMMIMHNTARLLGISTYCSRRRNMSTHMYITFRNWVFALWWITSRILGRSCKH